MDLKCEVDKLFHASQAPNTWKTYDTGLKSFLRFRDIYELEQMWPPRLDHVVNFVAYMSAKGLSYTTARSYITAISFNCKRLCLPDVSKKILVSKLLEGMKRLKGKADTRLPITPKLLTKLISFLPCICFNSYEAQMFASAFSLAFFAFLRVGEFTVTSGIQIENIIAASDVSLDQRSGVVHLHLRHSKTDQSNKGTTVIIPRVGGPLCPVYNLENYLKIRPTINGPLFCHYGGGPLTRYQFTALLNKTLKVIGIGTERYTSHSFRIGAATTAVVAGCSQDEVKTAGRWKSESYKRYIRTPLTTIPIKLI